jgi:hypothetical protein
MNQIQITVGKIDYPKISLIRSNLVIALRLLGQGSVSPQMYVSLQALSYYLHNHYIIILTIIIKIPVWKTLIRRILFFEGSKIETVFRDYNIKKEVLEKELIPYRDEIDKLIEVGTGDKLDQAAQMIEDVFEICLPDRGMEILNKCFSELLTHSQYTLEKDTQMKKRLNALMQIPFKAILTTNFDTIIPGNKLIIMIMI